MGAPWRTVEATGGTPLHAHLYTGDLHRLVERSAEVILSVLVTFGCHGNKDKDDETIMVYTLFCYHYAEGIEFCEGLRLQESVFILRAFSCI